MVLQNVLLIQIRKFNSLSSQFAFKLAPLTSLYHFKTYIQFCFVLMSHRELHSFFYTSTQLLSLPFCRSLLNLTFQNRIRPVNLRIFLLFFLYSLWQTIHLALSIHPLQMLLFHPHNLPRIPYDSVVCCSPHISDLKFNLIVKLLKFYAQIFFLYE